MKNVAINIPKPSIQNSSYFQEMIAKTPFEFLGEGLFNTQYHTNNVISQIPLQLEEFQYASDKWTIKQVLQHIVDCERVFNFRILSFSRNHLGPLPSFDENIYASHDGSAQKELNQILEEYNSVRESTITLMQSFEKSTFDIVGNCNNQYHSISALAWFVVAHDYHHLEVIKNRYLLEAP